MKEAGFPHLTRGFWAGLLAPAGTPADIVTRLNTEINATLATLRDEVQFDEGRSGAERWIAARPRISHRRRSRGLENGREIGGDRAGVIDAGCCFALATTIGRRKY